VLFWLMQKLTEIVHGFGITNHAKVGTKFMPAAPKPAASTTALGRFALL
jgi:hypothetical protein